jgi:hypothetical protein
VDLGNHFTENQRLSTQSKSKILINI